MIRVLLLTSWTLFSLILMLGPCRILNVRESLNSNNMKFFSCVVATTTGASLIDVSSKKSRRLQSENLASKNNETTRTLCVCQEEVEPAFAAFAA